MMHHRPAQAILLVGCALWSLNQLVAAEDYSTGKEKWQVASNGTFSTTDWPVETAFEIRVDYAAPKAGKATPSPAAKAKSSPSRPEFEYASDHSATLMGSIPGKNGDKLIYVQNRSLVFDAERRAVRVLDVFDSVDEIDHELTIRYTSRWRAGANVTRPRELFLARPAFAYGALVSVPGERKLPILMFVMGSQAKGWTRTVTTTGNALIWEYKGTLRSQGRVTLLHWLAPTDDATSETLRKVRESLVKNGMPADAFVDEQALKGLINFPMEIELETPPPVDDLPLVKALCREFKINRGPDDDHLVVAGLPTLKGRFSARDIHLKTREGECTLSLAKIAAIQGGAATGGKVRVYLTDGTAQSGGLTWQDPVFESSTVGSVNLTPESLDLLVLRINDSAEPPPTHAALWMSQDGDVHGLSTMPADPMRLRWAGGQLALPWDQVLRIAPLQLPDLGHEITLKDGSRIRSWFQSPAGLPGLSACLAYAANPADLMLVLEHNPIPAPDEGLRLQTSDKSLLMGEWAQAELAVATSTGLLRVPVSEIRRVQVKASKSEATPSLDILTTEDTSIRGAATSEGLAWKHGAQLLKLPWPLIVEIGHSQTPSAKP
ncbi:MAG TPA: hypothetical protein VD994_05160 [Prosthecobacter sp.]|nr:hypothetical protein [Prosthecobacter sp.]